MKEEIKKLIEEVWNKRELLSSATYKNAITEVVDLLDRGQLRVAEK